MPAEDCKNTLVWRVSTGYGIVQATRSYKCRLGFGGNAPGVGDGIVLGHCVRLLIGWMIGLAGRVDSY